VTPAERLVRDSALLGVTLAPADAARLLTLLDELERWNRSYNLTAIESREEMITHHLLDSLSISPELEGDRIADVGTGAGFPGLPLALVNPARQFTLIDSVGKKIRFVTHAARTLAVSNVTAVQARVETFQPAQSFDTVTARAFAPLPSLIECAGQLCTPGGVVLAMKGRRPEEELERLPAPWRLERCRTLAIPGLGEERCVLVLRRAPR
jgi:16S rRNA (guanine527-N7)-methyltransferase